MEISVLARQALVYGHVIAFALALATILKEDARFLRAKRIDTASLLASAKLVKWLLLALWATGLPMVIMDVGADVSQLLSKPKLVAKLIVVMALTLNGLLLHFIVFPMFTGKPKSPGRSATIAATLGAVSMTSWLYASFLGASRIVARYFSLGDFLVLYSLGLAVALIVAIFVVRGHLERLLNSSYDLSNSTVSQGYGLSIAILEAEIARLALTDIQRRLRAKHFVQQLIAGESSSATAPKKTAAMPWAAELRNRAPSPTKTSQRTPFFDSDQRATLSPDRYYA